MLRLRRCLKCACEAACVLPGRPTSSWCAGGRYRKSLNGLGNKLTDEYGMRALLLGNNNSLAPQPRKIANEALVFLGMNDMDGQQELSVAQIAYMELWVSAERS